MLAVTARFKPRSRGMTATPRPPSERSSRTAVISGHSSLRRKHASLAAHVVGFPRLSVNPTAADSSVYLTAERGVPIETVDAIRLRAVAAHDFACEAVGEVTTGVRTVSNGRCGITLDFLEYVHILFSMIESRRISRIR